MDSLPKSEKTGIWMVCRTNTEPHILRWYNNPLLRLLKCYGIDISEDSASRGHVLKKICSLLPLCATIMLLCVLTLNLTMTLPCALHTEGFYPFFFTILPSAIEAIIASLNLLAVFIYKRCLGTLMITLGQILEVEADNDGKSRIKRILRWFSWGVIVFLGLNTIVHFTFHYYIFAVLGSAELFQRFANCLIFRISSSMENLVMDIWIIVTHNLLFVIMAIYTYVCILITLSFRMITASCTSLSAMRQRHEQLCSLVAEADAVFSSMAFLWYLQIVSACCWIRALSNPFLSHHQYYFVQVASLFAEYVLSIIIVSCAGHAVNEEVIKTIPEPSSCANPHVLNHDEAMLVSNWEFVPHNEINLLSYFVRTSNSPPALTAMGLFTIRKGLILNITGTIITYSIILFEMRQ